MAIVIRDGVPLAPFTTLELGGPARHFIEASDEAAVVEALRWADGRKLPVAILGGGSNLVVADAGFDGLVVRIATRGLLFETSGGDAMVTAAAGEPWDALVAESVGRGLGGLECLSGIPGLVGATPIQNVGAYGQEVAETIRSVRVLERGSWQTRSLSPGACGFGYRDSNFKREPTRFVVLAVTFGLRPGAAPVLRYRELAERLAGA
ncbi:MAG TPA: UDP-N-acetylmuramate dehydrogenase, partial [Polyangia bacterium]|nr:UDP-N-acetylmuramate dehydrogenase [Polyangia bacterium]